MHTCPIHGCRYCIESGLCDDVASCDHATGSLEVRTETDAHESVVDAWVRIPHDPQSPFTPRQGHSTTYIEVRPARPPPRTRVPHTQSRHPRHPRRARRGTARHATPRPSLPSSPFQGLAFFTSPCANPAHPPFPWPAGIVFAPPDAVVGHAGALWGEATKLELERTAALRFLEPLVEVIPDSGLFLDNISCIHRHVHRVAGVCHQ